MPYVSFVTDEKFRSIVASLLEVGYEARRKAERDFNRNVIDPFAMLIEMASFSINESEWVASEKSRQSQKSLSNHIGLLHQKLLGAVDGWDDLGTGGGVDVVCEGRKIVAEIKNKHNTTKGSDKVSIYKSLEDQVMPKSSVYKDFTAYYVEIIPKKPQRFDDFFTPSDRKTGSACPPNKMIRQIDGMSFYELVTGERDALKQVFDVLPHVIADCSKRTAALSTNLANDFFIQAFGAKP
jgi:hypothetical protein